MAVERVKNLFNEGSRPCFLGSQSFTINDTLRAACKTFVSRPDDENGWRLFVKTAIIIKTAGLVRESLLPVTNVLAF